MWYHHVENNPPSIVQRRGNSMFYIFSCGCLKLLDLEVNVIKATATRRWRRRLKVMGIVLGGCLTPFKVEFLSRKKKLKGSSSQRKEKNNENASEFLSLGRHSMPSGQQLSVFERIVAPKCNVGILDCCWLIPNPRKRYAMDRGNHAFAWVGLGLIIWDFGKVFNWFPEAFRVRPPARFVFDGWRQVATWWDSEITWRQVHFVWLGR